MTLFNTMPACTINKNVKIYIDTKQNIGWLIAYRNGSTAMRILAEFCKDLICYDISDELILYLARHRKIPIYAPFRDPEIRFRSGLKVNLKHGVNTNVKDFKEWLLCQKTIIERLALYHGATFYHLFDQHLDHILWGPAVMAAYGYNIQLVPMYDFTDMLQSKYPDHLQQSIMHSLQTKQSQYRRNSFDESIGEYDELWNVYKSIFIENNTKNSYTFDDWMRLEKHIFNIYKDPETQKNFNIIAKNIVKDLLADPYYLTELNTPRVEEINKLIRCWPNFNNPIVELSHYHAKYYHLIARRSDFINHNWDKLTSDESHLSFLEKGNNPQNGIDTDPKV